MSMYYLCDLCRQPHHIDSIHWLYCSQRDDDLHRRIPFDYGRDDPKDLCRYFEPKEDLCRYFEPKEEA